MSKIMQFLLGLILTCLVSNVYANYGLLKRTYESKEKQYTIQYPTNWQFIDEGKGAVVFRGKAGKSSLPVSVNIQTIFTKKARGEYSSVKALMDDFWSQVPRHTEDVKFQGRRSIMLVESDGTKLSGEQTTLTFKENGETFKQWQIMVMTKDGRLFQAWAYRAPLKYYNANLSLAQSMLTSWRIY